MNPECIRQDYNRRIRESAQNALRTFVPRPCVPPPCGETDPPCGYCHRYNLPERCPFLEGQLDQLTMKQWREDAQIR